MTVTTVHTLPRFSETANEGTLLSWLVEPGDEVTEETPIAIVETGDQLFKVRSPTAGYIDAFVATEGDRVTLTTPFLSIDQSSPSPSTAAPMDDQRSDDPTTFPLVTRSTDLANGDPVSDGVEPESRSTGTGRIAEFRRRDNEATTPVSDAESARADLARALDSYHAKDYERSRSLAAETRNRLVDAVAEVDESTPPEVNAELSRSIRVSELLLLLVEGRTELAIAVQKYEHQATQGDRPDLRHPEAPPSFTVGSYSAILQRLERITETLETARTLAESGDFGTRFRDEIAHMESICEGYAGLAETNAETRKGTDLVAWNQIERATTAFQTAERHLQTVREMPPARRSPRLNIAHQVAAVKLGVNRATLRYAVEGYEPVVSLLEDARSQLETILGIIEWHATPDSWDTAFRDWIGFVRYAREWYQADDGDRPRRLHYEMLTQNERSAFSQLADLRTKAAKGVVDTKDVFFILLQGGVSPYRIAKIGYKTSKAFSIDQLVEDYVDDLAERYGCTEIEKSSFPHRI